MGPATAQVYSMTPSGKLEYNIILNIIVPQEERFDLKVSLDAKDINERIFDWTYQKRANKSVVNGVGQENMFLSGLNEQLTLQKNNSEYHLKWSRAITKDDYGNLFVLNISYSGGDSDNIKNDILKIEVL